MTPFEQLLKYGYEIEVNEYGIDLENEGVFELLMQ